ncbi:MAG: murein transglycosylase [Proteobacteria bacterium]|nr:murein transglycosylase [Pseudomonadota bacterium]
MRRLAAISLLSAVFLAGCGERAAVSYVPVSWKALDGWSASEAEGLTQAMLKSCDVYLKRPADKPLHADNQRFGTYGDWQPFCKELPNKTLAELKTFYEAQLTPVEVLEKDSKGLFTGYYEPELKGAFDKSAATPVPLHRRPPDLLEADLGAFNPDLKGKRIMARVEGNKIIPYHDRAQIDSGVLGDEQVLLWVSDPVEKFFLQVQGSGRVVLPGGQVVHVGYAGANGHRYVSIGKYMVEQGLMPLEKVSLQSIRQWLDENPARRQEILETNPSYVFFRLNDGGPFGTLGVELTPEHALAVDPKFIPLGVPVFVNTTLTAENNRPYARALAAQDTGGAIKGAVRGDIFFGHGKEAEQHAGHQRGEGRLFLLVPKNVKSQNQPKT